MDFLDWLTDHVLLVCVFSRVQFNIKHSSESFDIFNIALCGYPHVKVSIRDLGQFSTTASIFQQYNYFRQNSEENVTFTFYFSSFTSNFPCKILWDNKNIDANIFIFQITFWQWCLPLTKKLFWGVFLTTKWFNCVPNFHFVRHQQQIFCQ